MLETFYKSIVDWAKTQAKMEVVALVGSHARGRARPDSDLDLVLLVSSPQAYLADASWIATFGQPLRTQIEDWGKVTSLRVWYADGLEVEFGLAPLDWGSNPDDEGDARVIKDGIRVLYDRDGHFTANLRQAGFNTGKEPDST